jgi:hypothetical protein
VGDGSTVGAGSTNGSGADGALAEATAGVLASTGVVSADADRRRVRRGRSDVVGDADAADDSVGGAPGSARGGMAVSAVDPAMGSTRGSGGWSSGSNARAGGSSVGENE